MKTLPINLDLSGMKIVVFGGGAMASEKIERLRPYAPVLTIVSPVLNPVLREWVKDGSITYTQDVYRESYIGDHKIVFSATNDPAVDEAIYRDTRHRGVLLNTVDRLDYCDFIMPAVVQGEHFTLALSTGGQAAGLSRQIRQQLERGLRQEDEILDLLSRLREIFKRKHETFEERRNHLWTILNDLEAIERDD